MTSDDPKAHNDCGRTLSSFVVGFCVFSLGSAVAGWVTLENVHGLLALADNVLSGIIAGFLVLLYERRRQSEVEKKVRTVRLMNHHVRNALQIISAASYSFDSPKQRTTVQDAVRRIEWALREVLPGGIQSAQGL